MITLFMIGMFVWLIYCINNHKWLLCIMPLILLYGAAIYRNEVKIDECAAYLVKDEVEFNKRVFIDSNGQTQLDHIMLQYARPLCKQMNQVWYYNAGFLN